jgi:hypothetical protein
MRSNHCFHGNLCELVSNGEHHQADLKIEISFILDVKALVKILALLRLVLHLRTIAVWIRILMRLSQLMLLTRRMKFSIIRAVGYLMCDVEKLVLIALELATIAFAVEDL